MRKMFSLGDVSKKITRNFFATFFFIVFFMVPLSSIVYFFNHSLERAIAESKLENYLSAYKTRFSEKLSIVASSETFIRYINSGSMSRNEYYDNFLSAIWPVRTKEVAGIEIVDEYGENIFSIGNKTKYNVSVKLCYIGQKLNHSVGSCTYIWEIYFNEKALLQALQELNQDIMFCDDCAGSDLFSGDFLGSFPKKEAAYFPIKIDVKSDRNLYFLYLSFFILITFSFFVVWNWRQTKSIFRRHVSDPIERIRISLSKNESILTHLDDPIEFIELVKQIELWKIAVAELQKDKTKAIVRKQISEQVAHDIKSPLIALKNAMEVKKRGGLSEAKLAQFTEKSIQRIEQILMNLKAQKKESSEMLKEVISFPGRSVIPLILLAQYECNIKYNHVIFENSFPEQPVFSKFHGVDFLRVLTNILDNAIAASLSEQKKIKIVLSEDQDRYELCVIDYGKGIPLDIQDKVFEHEFTYGKKGGTGIGLSFSKSAVESWGGMINLQSVEGAGTTVTILLPKCERPNYVTDALDLTGITRIVYLDDDDSCHDILKYKLKSAKPDLEIRSYFSPPELKENFDELTAWGQLFLIDLQYNGVDEKGTDVIDGLKIKGRSVMITSSREDDDVLIFCELNNIKLIYKDEINDLNVIS